MLKSKWKFFILVECYFQLINSNTSFDVVENVTRQDASDWCNKSFNGTLMKETSFEEFRKSNKSADIGNKVIWVERTQVSDPDKWNSCDTDTCLNQGICLNSNDTVRCFCKTGFYGQHCEKKDCVQIPCMNNGTCINNSSNYVCKCQKGFVGKFCELDGCKKNICQNDGTCRLLEGTVFCSCKEGYYGKYCEYNAKTSYDYIGCYDDDFDRVFDMQRFFFGNKSKLLEGCVKRCSWLEARYFGLENSDSCFCGNNLPNETRHSRSSNCTHECPNKPFNNCSLGGRWALAVYKLNYTKQGTLDTKYTCSFDDHDGCFLDEYQVGKQKWDMYTSNGSNWATYAFLKEKQKGSKAHYGTALSLKYPKCLLLRYNIKNGSIIHLNILTNDSSLTSRNSKLYKDTKRKWINARYQLRPRYFQTVLLTGELTNKNSAVRIGDVKLLDGYCECPSTMCPPGMICNRRSKGCCSSPDLCEKYNQPEFEMDTYHCSYKYDIPCFMERVTDNWKRIKEHDGRRNIYVLRLEPNKSATPEFNKGILHSFKLPSNRIMCLTFLFFKEGNTYLQVSRMDIGSSKAVILLDKTIASPKETPIVTEIEFFAAEHSKIMIEAISRTGGFSITDIQLDGRQCQSNMEAEIKYIQDNVAVSNSIYVKNKGSVNFTVPESATYYTWTLIAHNGYNIKLRTTRFQKEHLCNTKSWLISYGSLGDEKFCGGEIQTNDSVVILRLVKPKNESVQVYVQWETYYESCPAIIIHRRDVFRVNYDCDFKNGSAVCAIPKELGINTKNQTDEAMISTNLEDSTVVISGDIIKQTISNSEKNSAGDTFIVPGIVGSLVLFICIAIIILVIKRRRSKGKRNFPNENSNQGNSRHNGNDESERINMDESRNPSTSATVYDIQIQNGEYDYSDVSKFNDSGNPRDNTKTVDNNDVDNYDPLPLKDDSNGAENEDNQYSRLQNNYKGFGDQQDIYDHTETSKRREIQDKNDIYDGLKDDIYNSTGTSDKHRYMTEDDTYDGVDRGVRKTNTQNGTTEGMYDHANAHNVFHEEGQYDKGI